MTDNGTFNVFAVGFNNTACDGDQERWGPRPPYGAMDARLINDVPLFTARTYLTSTGPRIGTGAPEGHAQVYRREETWD